MKNSKKTKSPNAMMPLLIALVVVGVVFGIIFVKSQETQTTQSKASFSPTEQCLKDCDNPAIQNPAACKLDCPALVAGTMKCGEFCNQNAKTPAKGACLNKCNSLNTDPCGDVCSINGRPIGGTQGTSCRTACASVKGGEKTCAEAFTQQKLRTSCIGAFE